MLTDITLLIVIVLLLGVIGVQSYFLYNLSQMVSLLNAAPSVDDARLLIRGVNAKKPTPPPEKKRNQIAVDPSEFDEQAIKNLRKQQDARSR